MISILCKRMHRSCLLLTEEKHVDALMSKSSTCLVYCLYLWDSEDTTTTRAGAERRSTSCRHWTRRKWPRWQIWKVDSRPSSVRLQGWVHTAALHTRMCKGLRREGDKKVKHVCLQIISDNKEDTAAQKGDFHNILGWGMDKERWREETKKKEGGIVRSKGRESTQGVLFQSVVDFRGLQRQSISNADMIQRFPVQLPMARQVL